MDPNYKNFLAWKKNSRSKDFIEKKDNEELEILRSQSNII
jgi:hypothetical protein